MRSAQSHAARSRLQRASKAFFDGAALPAIAAPSTSCSGTSRSRLPCSFVTVGLTIVMFVEIPKGFFPSEDTAAWSSACRGRAGRVSGGNDACFSETLGAIIARDPDVEVVRVQHGQWRRRQHHQHRPRFHDPKAPRRAQASSAAQRSSTGCVRSSPATSRARPCSCSRPRTSLSAARSSRGEYQYTLQDVNIAELSSWSAKMLEKMKTLPQLADPSTDLLNNAPQLTVHDQSRTGRALRHYAATHRRHPQRRLRPAPGHAILHPDQHLLGRLRSNAGIAGPALDARAHLQNPR